MESQAMKEMMLDIYRRKSWGFGGKKPNMSHQFHPEEPMAIEQSYYELGKGNIKTFQRLLAVGSGLTLMLRNINDMVVYLQSRGS